MDYCFTRGHRDFHAAPEDDGYCAAEARLERFTSIDPPLLANYIVRLFRAPAFLADKYTDDQIAGATWFMFGVASEYFASVRAKCVPHHRQTECVSAVTTLYTELFDRVCGKRGSDPDTDYRDTIEVDGAVYMVWDMDYIDGAILFDDENPHLVDPAFAVLRTILERCRTSACLVSALHGLGHVRMYHEEHNRSLARRAAELIDRFLAERRPIHWLREYAEAAKAGHIL